MSRKLCNRISECDNLFDVDIDFCFGGEFFMSPDGWEKQFCENFQFWRSQAVASLTNYAKSVWIKTKLYALTAMIHHGSLPSGINNWQNWRKFVIFLKLVQCANRTAGSNKSVKLKMWSNFVSVKMLSGAEAYALLNNLLFMGLPSLFVIFIVLIPSFLQDQHAKSNEINVNILWWLSLRPTTERVRLQFNRTAQMLSKDRFTTRLRA